MNHTDPLLASSPINKPIDSQPKDEIDLAEVIGLVRRNILILIGLPLAAALLGLYWSLAQTPIFRAVALIQLDPRPTQPLGSRPELYDPGYESSSYYFTQLRILESRKLAENLIDRLQLENVREFSGPTIHQHSRVDRLLSLIPGAPPLADPPPVSPAERRETTISRVMRAISADLTPSTTLIRAQFQSADPELAARAANALADLYIEELLQARLDIYAKATSWISQKLNEVSEDLSSAEERLQQYRDSQQIVNVGGNRGLLESELKEATQKLNEATRRRSTLESQYQEIQRTASSPDDLGDAQSLLLDPVVKDAAQAYLAAQTQVSALRQRYGERHPQYLVADATLDSVKKNYLNQLQIRARGLAAELEIARRDEAQLRSSAARARERLRGMDQDEFQLNMLERNVLSNRQLYDVFLARFNETESSSSFSQTNARIADPAIPPKASISPNVRKTVTLSIVFGILAALGLITLRIILHTRLEHAEEIEQLTTVPLVGVVPHCADRGLKKSAERYVTTNAKAPFVDALRSIKTALQLTMAPRPTRIIAVTSSEPGEGKTTLSVALSVVLATNARVLLIDADMRRPRVGHHFGLGQKSSQGLSAVLNEECTLDEALFSHKSSGLHVLPAGAPPPNPALLIESQRFGQLLASAAENYDFIIIDTPPVLATSDALHLTPKIDGFLLIARSEQTHKRALIGALKRMESVSAKGIGIILNNAPTKRNSYKGYYYYGSRHSY